MSSFLLQGLSTIQEYKAADILACGMLLYTMLTNSDPFNALVSGCHSQQALPGTTQAAKYSWPSEHIPSLSCQDLVTEMLEPDPAQRITTEQIMRHAWFLCGLPRELQVLFASLHVPLPCLWSCWQSQVFQAVAI
jgi:serine/threonine protein kinase